MDRRVKIRNQVVLWTIAIGAVLTSVCSGQETAKGVIAVESTATDALYIRFLNGKFEQVSKRVAPVLVLGGGEDPKEPPGGGDLEGLAKLSYEEAVKVGKPDEARMLASLYKATAKAWREKFFLVKPRDELDQSRETIKKTINLALSTFPTEGGKTGIKRWVSYIRAVNNELTRLFNDRELEFSQDGMASGYDAFVTGLERAAGGSAMSDLELGGLYSAMVMSAIANAPDNAALDLGLLKEIWEAIQEKKWFEAAFLIFQLIIGLT